MAALEANEKRLEVLPGRANIAAFVESLPDGYDTEKLGARHTAFRRHKYAFPSEESTAAYSDEATRWTTNRSVRFRSLFPSLQNRTTLHRAPPFHHHGG